MLGLKKRLFGAGKQPATELFNSGRQHYLNQNYVDALQCFQAAAEQGHTDSQCLLGVMYDNGQGVDRNYREAVKWFSLAADAGDSRAQFGWKSGTDGTFSDILPAMARSARTIVVNVPHCGTRLGSARQFLFTSTPECQAQQAAAFQK